MKNKYIPLNKQTKKMQKESASQSRGSWYGVNPVTKTIGSKKAYNRKQKHPAKDNSLF